MAEIMKGSLERQLQGKVARMQEKLNLTPDQVQAIRDILARRASGVAEAMQGIFSGKLDRERIAKLREENGDPETQIGAVLSPEQQTAYAAFKEEEAANTARLAANGELLQMQNALGLTQDQQDKAFAVLYEQRLEQYKAEAAGSTSANPAEAMQAGLERKLQALEGVLTAAQLEGYRQQQELQVKFLKGIAQQVERPVAHP